MKRRNPWLASFASILNPGLGFVYIGSLGLGIAISTVNLGLQAVCFASNIFKSFLPLSLVVIGSVLVELVLIILVFRRAKKLGETQVRWFNRGHFYVFYFLLFLVLAIVLLPNVPVKSYRLGSVSMSPTLEEGDCVLTDIEAYRHARPLPGDLIVFQRTGRFGGAYLKRCVALGGQTVKITDGVVYVDSIRFMPTLLTKRTSSRYLPADQYDKRIYPPGAGNEDNYGPVTLPSDSLFVLGDNRDNSFDSRYFGFIHADAVTGRALFIYWSHDLSRIGKELN